MKTYHVTFTYSTEVEAANESSAENKAIKEWNEEPPQCDDFGTIDIRVEENPIKYSIHMFTKWPKWQSECGQKVDMIKGQRLENH